jgi:hypothetical protein
MANTIDLAQKFLPLLDEKLAVEAKSSILNAPEEFVREGARAGSVLIPTMELQGLGDYSRATGFPQGDVTLEWQEFALTQDRGRTFSIDAMDNEESVGVAFGRLAGEFLRAYVAPEIDAYRFATLANAAGNSAAADLTVATVIGAIDTAITTLDDAEVPEEGRILFVSPTVYNMIKQSDAYVRLYKQDRNFEEFDGMPVIKVPQGRFISKIDLLDGVTTGQIAGGYVADTDGVDINFLIVWKPAVLGVVKHAVPRIFSPQENQVADAWKFDYRIYHDIFVPANKLDGVYVHTKAPVPPPVGTGD